VDSFSIGELDRETVQGVYGNAVTYPFGNSREDSHFRINVFLSRAEKSVKLFRCTREGLRDGGVT
jgi:hypothetical protein